MRVACVGDSITHGVGLQANETYPAQLQRRLRADGRADAEVLNFGLNGASLATTVERQCEFEHCEYTHTPLYAAMLRSKPDVAVILLGTNDVLFNPITAPPGNLGMAAYSTSSPPPPLVLFYQALGDALSRIVAALQERGAAVLYAQLPSPIDYRYGLKVGHLCDHGHKFDPWTCDSFASKTNVWLHSLRRALVRVSNRTRTAEFKLGGLTPWGCVENHNGTEWNHWRSKWSAGLECDYCHAGLGCKLLSADGLHPNAQGAKHLASTVARAIETLVS